MIHHIPVCLVFLPSFYLCLPSTHGLPHCLLFLLGVPSVYLTCFPVPSHLCAHHSFLPALFLPMGLPSPYLFVALEYYHTRLLCLDCCMPSATTWIPYAQPAA